MQPPDWNQFHAYRVFDEFLTRFVVERRSYVTHHQKVLDLETALADIESRFVADFDDSAATYENKLMRQFEGASEHTRIVFANVEYLWAMPVENIRPSTKRSYALRWFTDGEVVDGERYFFGFPHAVANPGPYYLRNKYWELIAMLRVLSQITAEESKDDLAWLKRKISGICHAAIYDGIPQSERFAPSETCAVHAALMHLAAPDRYESIISGSHREQICAVFGHLVENPDADEQRLLKQIKGVLFDTHGASKESEKVYYEGGIPKDPYFKERWFFYLSDVEPHWKGKATKVEQKASSAVYDVRQEEIAGELEGERTEVRGFRVQRSARLVGEVKKRDGFACRACGFHFRDQIVHVHHLVPLKERNTPEQTKLDDLITLCPNCHYLAHYLLQESDEYTDRDRLISRLRSIDR